MKSLAHICCILDTGMAISRIIDNHTTDVFNNQLRLEFLIPLSKRIPKVYWLYEDRNISP